MRSSQSVASSARRGPRTGGTVGQPDDRNRSPIRAASKKDDRPVQRRDVPEQAVMAHPEQPDDQEADGETEDSVLVGMKLVTGVEHFRRAPGGPPPAG